MLEHQYSGYDPYDGLMSPLFKVPVLGSNRYLRFGTQQVVKRLPFNVRPLLRINPGTNPVTLGLSIQAYASLMRVWPERRDWYNTEVHSLLGVLQGLASKPYAGACWGYDFDWESRNARFPAFLPTVVATGIVTNGLFAYYNTTGDVTARDLCVSAAAFVVHDLQRYYEGELVCFSYSPRDHDVVLNATMKGARILAQAYAISGDDDFRLLARSTVAFVMRHQRGDGAWVYSIGDGRSWVDNFHTGYILDCLQSYAFLTGDNSFAEGLKRGFGYYRSSFIDPDGAPRYYDRSRNPIDATAAAQSIITLVRNDDVSTALSVALWMISNMQDPKGFFYYQQRGRVTIRIPYMRWSNAWMLTALSQLLERHYVLD